MNQRDKLDKIFDQVESVIMSRQHPVTGLMPASTAVTTHGDYTDAWVRDNVYSIISIWALGMAYRRQHESERADQLEQTTILKPSAREHGEPPQPDPVFTPVNEEDPFGEVLFDGLRENMIDFVIGLPCSGFSDTIRPEYSNSLTISDGHIEAT